MINNPTPHAPATVGRTPTRAGQSSDLAEAASLAAQLRRMCANPALPNLNDIARELKVTAIRADASLDRLGHTTWTAGGAQIVLQEGQKATRKRFTLAHELAHVYLEHGLDTNGQGDGYRDYRHEERLADAIAGHLLVPDNEITRLRELTPTIAEIRETADRLQVSQAVVARRLADADLTHHWLLVNFKRATNGPWLFWRVTGRLRGLSSTMRVLESEYSRLDRLPERDVPMEVLTRIGDHTFRLQGTGNRRTSLTLMLVDHVRPEAGTLAPAHRGTACEGDVRSGSTA